MPEQTFTIEVEGKSCTIKKPNRQVVESCLPLLAQKKLITAGELIINACWIDGDEEIKTDDDYLMPAAIAATDVLEFKNAELKKN